MHNVFVITDPGLDPDDLVTAWLLTKVQQAGLINVEGMIANFSPSEERALLLKGVLNQLEASSIPVSIGTDCNKTHEPRSYEFDYPYMADLSQVDWGVGFGKKYTNPLLEWKLRKAEDSSISLLLISGLTDIYQAIQDQPDLLKQKLRDVYIMGGASWENDRLVVDPTASNNRFDPTLDSQLVYDFFIDNGIPLKVLTRYAAYAAGITPQFYEDIKDLNSVGKHLHHIQESALKALWHFANNNPSEHRQNRSWFSQTFCGMEDLPISAEESPWPYVKKLALYDPLTLMWMVFPDMFSPSFSANGMVEIVGLSANESGIPNPKLVINKIKDLILN